MNQMPPSSLPRRDEDISLWLDIDRLCPEDDSFPNEPNFHQGESPLTHNREYHLVNDDCLNLVSGGPVAKPPSGDTATPTAGCLEGDVPGNRKDIKPEFSVICFPSNPDKPHGNKKKRRDFTQERRLQVAQVRKAGACIRCRIRRVSCGQGEPCSACLKAAGALGLQICSREKLTRIRFATMDIHYLDVTTRLLDQELVAGTTHVSPPRKIVVSLDCADTPQLEVEVQDYYRSDAARWLCCWVVMNPVDGRLDLFREESSHYALTRLPTPETLISWAEDIMVHQEKRVIGLHQAMDGFIMKYSKSEQDLPMKSLVQKVHQLNCLAKIRLGLVLCVDQAGDAMPPSCAFHTQFCLISKSASQSLEMEILNQLEKIVFGTSGIGPSNGLALWASLWCLILMYRKLVRSYVAFRRFPCHVPKEYSGFPETKLQMGTNFYHHMVSIYAALFRTTTPLYTDFRIDSNRKLLCNDTGLIQSFMNLRTESFYFRKFRPYPVARTGC